MAANDQQSSIAGHRLISNAFWRVLPAGMRRRWWLFRLFDLIARLLPVPARRRGVLVVRMDGIGDMVLFRNSLDYYAEAFGVDKSDITVLGCDSWRSIAPEVFAGYRVITINEHRFAKRVFYRFRISLMVRGLNPAIAVCDQYLRRAMMADSLVWVSGAPRAVSSLPFINEKTRSEYLYYMSQNTDVIATGDYPDHEIARHARFVSQLTGREIAPAPPSINWRDDTPPVDLLDPGAPYAVLNPGSNEYGRRWPMAKYLELAKRLRDKGLGVVLVGGKGEVAATGDNDIIDLSGKTTLAQLLDILNHAALVVSNDTGPAHLSIALGTPSVVIVGGGHFGCFVPYPDQACPDTARFVYEKMDCYHCFWNCPKRATNTDSFPCVEAVSMDAVWDAAEQLLDARP
ncbi:MAG: glycosyltransferase family 9 protein [Rhodospirillaceae bacterium]|jgi:ADP-heptose:LPS heptosyltransferase|nr:glycosyltransferase family 9 protein [Rhodospirillaceae bacterium]MBT4220269.1 glycosyltransferase family 9 protein [Rhodospirillaceae bacterium]MBT5014572.1 glycosyltransferase family 9 protein [Rhodospirillaceae bacterium]MBT5308422.1 glycosyltransferase family 9 protein [Rhodospirillaceae bacterium]MBT6406624.1 glycosyltransferase family 9 protein [Rhodospirillaceae bacterium]